jgi:hypothetical protein
MAKQAAAPTIRQGDVAAEVWLPVAGFEGRYEISSLGRVRSLARKYCSGTRVLGERANKGGYLGVALYDGTGRAVARLVHRLVCAAFNGAAPADRPDVNHIDGNKKNNAASNLEWTNDSLNVTHAFRVLGVKKAITRPWLGKFGAAHHASKPVIRVAADGATQRFAGVMEAARQTGCCFKKISAVCRGERTRHAGYQWRFDSRNQA